MNSYYVYTLAYPDGTVFYVGKGIGNRIDMHEVEAKQGKQSYKCNVIRLIWKDSGQVVKTKVQDGMEELAAYLLEIDLIRMYGREHLTNLTDGGEGGPGRIAKGRTTERVIMTLSLEVLEFLAQEKERNPQFSKSAFVDRAVKAQMEREGTIRLDKR